MKSTKTLFAVMRINMPEKEEKEVVYPTSGSLALAVEEVPVQEPVVQAEEEFELEIPAFLIKLQNERKMAKWGHL